MNCIKSNREKKEGNKKIKKSRREIRNKIGENN
jgi:hypothetical protein